jgi:serine/threonine protein kinase
VSTGLLVLLQEKHEAVNEVMLLASINSPYVVKYYDSFMENDELHIVMEYCNRCGWVSYR